MKKLKPGSREWNMCFRLIILISLMLIVIAVDIAAIIIQSEAILDSFKQEIFLMYVIYLNFMVCAISFAFLINIYLIVVKKDDEEQ